MRAYEAVRQHARGARDDYALKGTPLGQGGQAEVFEAVHKPTGRTVAFKRLMSQTDEARARMRREIEVCQALSGTPHLMPVLDIATDQQWFVMPLAHGNLADLRDRVASDDALVELLEHIAIPLIAAHELGYVHRDLKPANILLLEGEGWLVADWGLVRRPPGMTSVDGRTVIGYAYGTVGFAAPELAIDAHQADARADVYSIGQLIGWIKTGTEPLANTPLIPRRSPWDGIVRMATRHEPTRRLGSLRDLLELVHDELSEPAAAPVHRGQELLEQLGSTEVEVRPVEAARTSEALNELLDLATRRYDEGLYIDVLPQLSSDLVAQGVVADPGRMRAILDGYRSGHFDWGHRDFNWANAIIGFFLNITRAAENAEDTALFEDAVDLMLDWDNDWDRWRIQRQISTWLRNLDGEWARIVARTLRNYNSSRDHFTHLADDADVHPRISAALRSA